MSTHIMEVLGQECKGSGVFARIDGLLQFENLLRACFGFLNRRLGKLGVPSPGWL
jgi:hypothetical protein